MDKFINVIKRDPQVLIKIQDITDKYCRLLHKYQSKIGCDCLFQNVISKEIIILMSFNLIDTDIELKLKISRIKYLENRL